MAVVVSCRRSLKYINEVIVAVGLSLLAYGFNQPWSAYQEAEIQAINLKVEAERFAFSYSEYASRVNQQIELYNSCLKAGPGCDREQLKEEVLSLEPETQDWNARTHKAMVESQKNMRLARHFHTMKRIWFTVGLISCLVGLILVFVGVRGIIKSARNR